MKTLKHFLLFTAISTGIIFAQTAKFSALGFYEMSYTTDKDEDISNEFEFNRVYLTFEKKMSETLSYKFQSDVGRKSDDKRLELYLKTAKVDWNTEYGKFVIGLQSTNLFKVQEKTWGYRSIEKSPMDKNNWGSSAVMGLGYYNHIDKINYSFLITNGPGYKKPEDDSYKRMYARVYYGQDKLNSKEGINAGVAISYEPYGVDGGNSANTIVGGIFGGYARGPIRFGVEFEQEIDSEADNTINMTSAYGNYNLWNGFDLYGRLDNINYGPDSKNYIITGISISPEKGLKIMPNIRYTKPSTGDASVKYNVNFEFNIK